MPSVIAVKTSGTTIILMACTNAAPTGASFDEKCGKIKPTTQPNTSPISICIGNEMMRRRRCCDINLLQKEGSQLEESLRVNCWQCPGTQDGSAALVRGANTRGD